MSNNRKGFIGLVLMIGILVALGIGMAFLWPKDSVSEDDVLEASDNLSIENLKNAEYSYSGDTIKLVDGTYPLKPLSSKDSPDDYYVKLESNYIVHSDVNGDGLNDALVVLVSRLGGTGVFRNLAVVINDDGQARSVADVFLGDRVDIKALEVTGNVISVTVIPEGGEELKVKKYEFVDNKLVLQK